MTDDDFEALVLFHLMDADLSDVKYAAVDHDGEIVFGIEEKLVPYNETSVLESDAIYVLWKGANDSHRMLTNNFLPFDSDELPDNHRTVMITL